MLPIVEGDGDRQAVPELIRRVAFCAGHHDLQVLQPHKRGDLPKVRARFEDFLRTALLDGAPILWVMDYKETVHQVKLPARADLDRLRERSPSFNRFEKAVLTLLSS